MSRVRALRPWLLICGCQKTLGWTRALAAYQLLHTKIWYPDILIIAADRFRSHHRFRIPAAPRGSSAPKLSVLEHMSFYKHISCDIFGTTTY